MLGSASASLLGGPEGIDESRPTGSAAAILGSVRLPTWRLEVSRPALSRPSSSVSSCEPMMILSPGWTSVRLAMRCPLTMTPLRLCRSSTVTVSFATTSRAWRRDTSGSSSDSWQPALRPTANCPSLSSRS